MKITIWDILTGIILLGIICVVGVFSTILINPGSPINPLPPQVARPIATIALPKPTDTPPGMPPTWTPTAGPAQTDTPTPDLNAPTPLPSQTPVRLPTFTQIVLPTFTPTRRVAPGIGGGSCSVTNQTPSDGTAENRAEGFTVTWTLKNTSDNTWRGDSVDIAFKSIETSSGGIAKIHTGGDLQDMKQDVAPGGSFSVSVNMQLPASASIGDTFIENWALQAGSNSLCKFFVQVTAK